MEKIVKATNFHNYQTTVAEKLFPCENYQPYCDNYAVNGQCRDVWTQKNCRKSCKLCDGKQIKPLTIESVDIQ